MKGVEMNRERVKILFEVEVDLDPVPGTFHTKENVRQIVPTITQSALNDRIPHYNPVVRIKDQD